MHREVTGSNPRSRRARSNPLRVRRRSRVSPGGVALDPIRGWPPVTAHAVNVEGTLNLLEFAQHEAESRGRPVVFSLSGPPSPRTGCHRSTRRNGPDACGKISGRSRPRCTGCNKLYCEQLGHYYARHYKQLAPDTQSGPRRLSIGPFPRADFGADGSLRRHLGLRAGNDSTPPAQGKPYACFVRPDAKIPFMAMPDGVQALLALAAAPRERITQTAYNLGAFAPTADEVRVEVMHAFPKAAITYAVDGNARASSTRGPKMWTIRPRAAIGDSRRSTIFRRRFGSTSFRLLETDTRTLQVRRQKAEGKSEVGSGKLEGPPPHVIDIPLLVRAYREGVFPMAMETGEIGWFSPDPRGVLPLDTFHLSSRLARLVRQGRFQVVTDVDFEGVMRACAERTDEEGTWISDEIVDSYVALHPRRSGAFRRGAPRWRACRRPVRRPLGRRVLRRVDVSSRHRRQQGRPRRPRGTSSREGLSVARHSVGHAALCSNSARSKSRGRSICCNSDARYR